MSVFRQSIQRVVHVGACCAALLLTAPVARAAVINGGFETGDFTGWTQVVNGGAQSVVTTHDGVNFTTYAPIEGTYFAVLTAGDADQLVRLEQQLAMAAGDVLSGWAFFSSSEFGDVANDFATVDVLDAAGALVAQPYRVEAVTVGLSDEPWTFWSFTAPAAQTYTLRLAVANAFDDFFSSQAGFDDIRLEQATVPEPALLALWSAGVMAAALRRRRGPQAAR